MKHILIILVALIGIEISATAQQTVVIQNSREGTSSQQTGEFSINGISSRQDIGGVEAEGYSSMTSRYQGTEYWNLSVKFINYNTFAVTVLYKAGKDNITGSVILQPNEEKTKKFGTTTTGLGGNIGSAELGVATITRKL